MRLWWRFAVVLPASRTATVRAIPETISDVAHRMAGMMTKVDDFYICPHGGYHVNVTSDSHKGAYNAAYKRIVREVQARQGEQKVSLRLKVENMGYGMYHIKECEW